MDPITDLLSYLSDHNVLVKKRILGRNEVLKQPDTIDTNLYFVLSGSLVISIFREQEEHVIRFGYQKNIITALDSFITGKPSEFSIKAIKKTELQIITKSTFNDFIQSSSTHQQFWNSILEDLVLQQMEREKDLLISSPRERYERVLKRSPQLFQEIPSRYIAKYLRMTPETLSRLKKP